MEMQIFRELLAEIDEIAAVDIHSHIRASSPAAADLSDIALYHYIKTELESAGVDPSLLEMENAKKRVLEAVKQMPSIANTTTYWCLNQIVQDLYGTGESLHKSDVEALWTRVEQSANDPGWVERVLDQANVSKVFLACDFRKRMPKASDRFVPTLRLDALINEAHMGRTWDALAEAVDHQIYEVADVKKALGRLFEQAKENGAVAAAVAVEPATDFAEGDRSETDRILSLIQLGQKTNREDRKAIRSYAMDQVLKSCAEYEMPLQLMLGVRWARTADRRIAAYDPDMVTMYADLFTRHSGVTFDVFTASEQLNHELAVVSRLFPNVYLSGYWWYQMFPERIRSMVRERAQMLPMTKSCGFFSDAYCVEWVYGKAKLARREIAFALTQMVQEGYLSMGAAVETARCYLETNPRRIYGIESK